MSHTIKEKEKLLQRVRRVRGQVEAVERALEAEQECSEVLRLIAASRGAMNSLMAEVMEDHIRHHMVTSKSGRQTDPAAQQLIDVVRAYLK
jgi:DNA-binding FrmR family transcriptional regulator